MKIEKVMFYDGPNVYSHKPVVAMSMDIGEFEERPSNAITGFTGGLLELIPALDEHTCSRGRPGGFVERLREGTYLGHITEHVAIELQTLAGYGVSFGTTRRAGAPSEYLVVIGRKSRAAAEAALYGAVEIVNRLLDGERFSLDPYLGRIRTAVARLDLGPSTGAIVEAALARGIPAIRLGSHSSLVQLGYGCRQKWIQASVTARTSAISVDIACDKWLTKQLLKDLYIPVPEGDIAETEEEALRIAERIGLPVVVKPHNSNQGKGVSMQLRDPVEIRTAFRLARDYSKEVIVERFIRGKDYRLLVVKGEVAAAAERVPAYVTGDGLHSVRQLVEIANRDPRRGEDHELPLTRIKIDPTAVMVLARQGMTLDSVPQEKRRIYLRETGNLSTGGTAVDVTEMVHPANLELAIRAVRAVGLDVAGVDLVVENIALPVEPQGGAIVEINAAPGLRMHMYPSAGSPRDVAGRIVDMLFPPGTPSRIPIVAITGTNGKTTTTRMIGRILAQTGRKVGMTTTDGIYIGESGVVNGDTTGPFSAQMVLRDPSVEAAVLETARGGILRAGLGFDYCDLSVVLNVTDDHRGQYQVESLEDMAGVKSLLVERTFGNGAAVLNADDPLVAGMARKAPCEVVYFTMNPEGSPLVQAHLAAGKRAVYLQKGVIVMAAGGQAKALMAAGEIPATFGGAAVHNVENALAAAAAAMAMGVADEAIKRALEAFSCTPECNPGRFNLFTVNDFEVLVDYGHNPAGFEAISRAVSSLDTVKAGGRRIGVIAAPGDRPDETIIEMGRIAGRNFDLVYIKEDDDLRGRAPGATAGLLRQGVHAAGMAPEVVRVVPREEEAVRVAMSSARPGDLVAIFYEKYDRVVRVVAEFQASVHRSTLQEEQELVAAAISGHGAATS
ncbi:MAG: cyanophycin synthetase [Firmicutes bacterium]|nr:cyanophycin synthetase [Bacillota bacterium]